jgi:hypothetical protein
MNGYKKNVFNDAFLILKKAFLGVGRCLRPGLPAAIFAAPTLKLWRKSKSQAKDLRSHP